METWYYGIDPDFAQFKEDNSQIIREIARKVSSFRHDLFFGTMIESKIESMEKKIEKPITVSP